jgi:hypothetical protein
MGADNLCELISEKVPIFVLQIGMFSVPEDPELRFTQSQPGLHQAPRRMEIS